MKKIIRINEKNVIVGINYKPSIVNQEQVESDSSYLIDIKIPQIEQKFGKRGVMYFEPETETIRVEYVDRPLTTEEQMQELKDSLDYMILQNEGLV